MSVHLASKPSLREAAPHLVCLLSLVLLYRTFLLGSALAIGLLLALVYFRANSPTFIWQFIYALGGAAIGYALGRQLDDRPSVEFAALFLGAAIGRLPLSTPVLKGRLDFVLLAFVVAALGASRQPPKLLYVVASVALTATLAWSAGEVSPLRVLKDHPAASLLVLLAGGAVAGLLGWGTPRLSGASPYFAGQRGNRTGFANGIRLGESGGFETSDTIVMRIYGGHVDYLRGAVQDQFAFERDRWLTSHARVRFLYGVPNGSILVSSPKPTTHLYSALGTTGIVDGATVDGYGASTINPGVSDYTIDPSLDNQVDPPEDMDVALAEKLRARVLPLANDIVKNESDDMAKVALLSHYLTTNYHYTLSRSQPRKERSALLDFLFVSKEGHCEYFASALAVLARALGIPARVVAGYRVVEANGYSGYEVVREKNAHAWVEVWDARQKRWRTEDPTPATEAMMERRSRDLLALFDAGREKLAALGRTMTDHPALLLGTLGVLSFGLISRRLWNRTRKKARAVGAGEPQRMFRKAQDALDKLGLRREPWEGIETFAERVREAGHDDAAAVLVRYAALRYDPEAESTEITLVADLADLAVRLEKRISCSAGATGRRVERT
jgi:transglutaminase-like putative cysteine protease